MWDALLEGLGSILAFLYDFIPSYGVAIVLLTVLVRIVLLPLTIRQTRSMQAMQRLQPKLKELQRKYKGNRQKLNEEMMKLYKEHQVNPLGGCLPLLLQLPVFFALFQVLNTPVSAVAIPAAQFSASSVSEQAICLTRPEARGTGSSPTTILCDTGEESRSFPIESFQDSETGAGIESQLPFLRFCVPQEADPEAGREDDGFLCRSLPGALRVPRDSELFSAIVEDRATFLGMHLSCSPTQAVSEDGVRVCAGPGTSAGVVPALPYFLMVALMVGSTFYQQKQMQRASAGPAAQQQQLMLRIMPVFLGLLSISIAAGVLVYWVTTNAWQIGQQTLMLRSSQGPEPAVSGDGKTRAGGKKQEESGSTGKSGTPGKKDGRPKGPASARGRKKRRKR
jgi:YidC/Oxa1 family membrane protein insertase